MSEALGSAGRLAFYGSVGVEAEDYQYDSEREIRDRMRLRTRFELNGRGYLWDPRFAVFDGGITLQRDSVQVGETDTSGGDTRQNMIGYRINTTWFANRPYPLTVFASRNQNTMSDFWSPTYQLTTSNFGARWGMEHNLLGHASFYLDHTSAKSDSDLVPRSESNLMLGVDAKRKLRPKQWGESEFSYGYRHTEWDEQVYDSRQRQDYLYLNDRTLFGEKANLTANMTYYNRSDEWGFMGSGQEMGSSFLGLNSALTMQQSEKFRHYYGLGVSISDFGSSQSASQSVSSGMNYRFNDHWQANAMLSLSASRSESTVAGASLSQEGSTTSGSTGLMYSDRWGNLMVNAGYSVAMMQTDTSASAGGLPGQRNATHSASLGYARMNSKLFSDSLQLRASETLGEPGGSERNIRYSVTSLVTESDMLQGVAEYRRYQQEYAVWNGTLLTPDDEYYYYELDSRSSRLDFGWLHRFSEASSLMLSTGATSSLSQDVAIDTRYSQARATMRLRSALQWTALARVEKIEGLEYIAGRKKTIESDLNYRIGKWQATARYRLRDARLEYAPFKERSIMLLLKRNYGGR